MRWREQYLWWRRELRPWCHRVTKVLHVLKQGDILLFVGLLHCFQLPLVGPLHVLNLLLSVPLRFFYMPLPLGPLCYKLCLQYLIQTLEYKANI
jgi:hypothetical protein